MYPIARKTGVLNEPLAFETIVYDRVSHKAHCLNRTVAFVWKNCDGQTDIEEIARLLPEGCGQPANSDVVLLALRELDRAHLLEEGSVWDLSARVVSRRALTKKLAETGLSAALLLPIVTSIVAPTPAMAGSRPKPKPKPKPHK